MKFVLLLACSRGKGLGVVGIIDRACGLQEIRREDNGSVRRQFASCRFSVHRLKDLFAISHSLSFGQ